MGVIENIHFGNSRESSNLGMHFSFFLSDNLIELHGGLNGKNPEMKLMEVLKIFNENMMEPNEGFCSHV